MSVLLLGVTPGKAEVELALYDYVMTSVYSRHGYCVQVGMDKGVTEDTRLTYCTTGVLLQKLINAKNMQQYTHIILDEVSTE